MPRLSSQQITELGDSFLAMAQAVGNYRIENRATLSKKQNQEIKDYHWTLLHFADEMFTTSASLVLEDVQPSLDTIKGVTAQIKETFHKLEKVQKAINIAAAGVTLGAAIISKDPQAVKDAISGLVSSFVTGEA